MEVDPAGLLQARGYKLYDVPYAQYNGPFTSAHVYSSQ